LHEISRRQETGQTQTRKQNEQAGDEINHGVEKRGRGGQEVAAGAGDSAQKHVTRQPAAVVDHMAGEAAKTRRASAEGIDARDKPAAHPEAVQGASSRGQQEQGAV
jgi:hypothetical protein